MKTLSVSLLLAFGAIAIFTNQLHAAEQIDANALVERIHSDCAAKWGFAGPIATCVGDKEREYGDELARVYQKALAIAGTNAPLLRQAQRSWLIFQQLNCKFHQETGAVEGPSFARSSLNRCELHSTLQRLDELHKFVEGH